MKIFINIILLVLVSCNGLTQKDNFSKFEKKFKKIYGSDSVINENGDLIFNWKYGKVEKVKFNINDVEFEKIKHDNKFIISIKCINTDCLFSPVSDFQKFSYAVTEFENLKDIEEALNFFINLKKYIKK